MKTKYILISSIIALVICVIVVAIVVLGINGKTQRINNEMTLGYKYILEEDYDEAILAFEKIINIDSKNVEARMGLADVYIRKGRYKKAENQLEEVLDLKGDYIDAYIKLADIRILNGDYEAAIELLDEAQEEHSDRDLTKKLKEVKELEAALENSGNGNQVNPQAPTPNPDSPIPSPSSAPVPEPSSPAAEGRKRGNSAGNIENGGSFALLGDWVYYTNTSDNYSLYKCRLDGSEATKINNENSFYINAFDDWIYYSSNNSIRKIRPNGGESIKIIEGFDCFSMTVIGDWIYFCEYGYFDEYGNIYKMRVDGSDKTKVCEDDASVMIVVDNWIYYSRDDSDGIYRIRTDGSNKTKLSESGYCRAVEGQYVYYYDDINGGLFKMRTDGNNKSLITSDYIYFMNVSGDWIYYANATDDGVYKIKHDGSGKTELCSDFCFNIHIINDWIYHFYDDVGWINVYKMKTDGSERQVFIE